MRRGDPASRWLPLAALGLVLLDTLVLSRASVVLRSGHSPAPHEAALLTVLIGLQLLLGVVARLQASVHRYRTLKRAFQQELDLSRQLLESSDTGVALLNDNAQLAYVNRAFCDLLGRPLHAVLPDAALPATLPGSGEDRWPLTVTRPGGDALNVVLRGTPRRYDGRVVGTILSLTRAGAPTPGSPESGLPAARRPAEQGAEGPAASRNGAGPLGGDVPLGWTT